MYLYLLLLLIIVPFTTALSQQIPLKEAYIEAGNYYVGDVYGNHDYQHHSNTHLLAYYMVKTEITYQQYQEVKQWANNNGYRLDEGCNGSLNEECLDPEADNGQHPVTYIDWWGTLIFANALSEMNRYRPVYFAEKGEILRSVPDKKDAAIHVDMQSNGYRLPTYNEWQVAARGGKPALDKGIYGYQYAGGNIPNLVAWGVGDIDEGFTTHPVASKNPNILGIYDMSGNVSEWLFEQYEMNQGTEESTMMTLFCGGDIFHLGANLSSCDMHSANYTLFNVGIRLIRHESN